VPKNRLTRTRPTTIRAHHQHVHEYVQAGQAANPTTPNQPTPVPLHLRTRHLPSAPLAPTPLPTGMATAPTPPMQMTTDQALWMQRPLQHLELRLALPRCLHSAPGHDGLPADVKAGGEPRQSTNKLFNMALDSAPDPASGARGIVITFSKVTSRPQQLPPHHSLACRQALHVCSDQTPPCRCPCTTTSSLSEKSWHQRRSLCLTEYLAASAKASPRTYSSKTSAKLTIQWHDGLMYNCTRRVWARCGT
jgi:hypothetical protein